MSKGKPLPFKYNLLKVEQAAEAKGLSIEDYLQKYDANGSLKEFNKETPAQMEEIVITSKKKPKDYSLFFLIGLSLLVLILFIVSLKKRS